MNDTDLMSDLIKLLRKDTMLSQFQMAELLKIPYSTYSMIESGHRKPNHDILISLSNVLQFDFITFSEKQNSYASLEHYLLATTLINYINSSDIDNIYATIKTNPIINEFIYGEPLIIKVYCEVLILIKIEKNIDLAYISCVDFLNISNINDFEPIINMPYQYYSIITTFGYCLHEKEMFDDFIILYKNLIDFLENLYFNSDIPFMYTPSYYKKYYIVCLNNIADTYFTLNEYDDALQICNKAIEKSNIFNKLNILPTLLKLKVEILYKLNNYTDAKLTYIQYKAFCEITNNLNYLETSTIKFRTLYPNLFIE